MRTNLWRTFWIGFGAIGLFYFQNCAPAPTNELAQLGMDGDVAMVADNVGLISNDGVAFQALSYNVESPEVAQRFDGACTGHDGQQIDWRLWRSVRSGVEIKYEVLLSGSSICSSGSFRVFLDAVPFNECSEVLTLRAAIGVLPLAQTLLYSKCN